MQFLSNTNFVWDENRFGPRTAYPYLYLAAYHDFLASEGKQTGWIIGHNSELLPVEIISAKGFLIWKLQHRPLLRANDLTVEAERTFLNQMVESCKTQKWCHRIAQPPSYAIFQAVPDSSSWAAFGTIQSQLTDFSEDELFAKFDAKYRTVIRGAIKNGVTLKWGIEQVETYFALYSDTMARSQMWCEPEGYFNRLAAALGDSQFLCGVSYHEGQPQGGIFVPYTKFGGYYVWGGSAARTAHRGAIKYLQWEAIKKLKAAGTAMYDMVGVRVTEVEKNGKLDELRKFKEGFGGDLVSGYLWKLDINPGRCKVYDTLLKVKMRGKSLGPDIIDEETAKRT